MVDYIEGNGLSLIRFDSPRNTKLTQLSIFLQKIPTCLLWSIRQGCNDTYGQNKANNFMIFLFEQEHLIDDIDNNQYIISHHVIECVW